MNFRDSYICCTGLLPLLLLAVGLPWFFTIWRFKKHHSLVKRPVHEQLGKQGKRLWGAYLSEMRHFGIAGGCSRGITSNENRLVAQRGLASCADLRACGRQNAAVGRQWLRGSGRLAGERKRRRYISIALQITAELMLQSRDFVRRVRNAGPVPPTKRSSLLLTVSRPRRSSCIAKSGLNKLSSMIRIINCRSWAGK